MLSMVAYGFDRYNVMVKGLEGFEMTYQIAIGINVFIWIYCIAVCIPPFFGWGGYALGKHFSAKVQVQNVKKPHFSIVEGFLVTCSYDYLSDDFNRKSFLFHAFFGNYLIPMGIMIYFYIQIIKTVIKYQGELKRTERINIESGQNIVSPVLNGFQLVFFQNYFIKNHFTEYRFE